MVQSRCNRHSRSLGRTLLDQYRASRLLLFSFWDRDRSMECPLRSRSSNLVLDNSDMVRMEDLRPKDQSGTPVPCLGQFRRRSSVWSVLFVVAHQQQDSRHCRNRGRAAGKDRHCRRHPMQTEFHDELIRMAYSQIWLKKLFDAVQVQLGMGRVLSS